MEADGTAPAVLSLTVPTTSYSAVEYPGYVRNVDRAMQTLGGGEAIAASLRTQSSFLKLAFRPEDPSSHPLFGDRQETHNHLLLRISRRRGAPEGEAPSVSIAARVPVTFRFGGLCDFQFLPVADAGAAHQHRDYARAPPENQPGVSEPSGVSEPLMTVPPLFSKADEPFNFAFRQFLFKDSRPHVKGG